MMNVKVGKALVLMALLVAGALLLIAASPDPAQDGPMRTAHPLDPVPGIPLVCPQAVDLKDNLVEIIPHPAGCTFWKWFLMRGRTPAKDQMTVLAMGTDGQNYYHRDTTVVVNTFYFYVLDTYWHCPDYDFLQPVIYRKVLVDDTCQGFLYRGMTLSGGPHKLGGLQVWKGATLTISSATVQGGTITSAGHDSLSTPPGGLIQIHASTLENTEVYFTTKGDNHLKNSTVRGEPNNIDVTVSYEAEVQISGNDLISGWIWIEDAPYVTVYNNDFQGGMMSIHSQSGLPVDQIKVFGNRFVDPVQGTAISQRGGGAMIYGNRFESSDPSMRRTALDVSESSATGGGPAEVHFVGNTLTGQGHAIMVSEGAVAYIGDNLILDNSEGIFLRYDAQATIEGNTFMRNKRGVELWDQPTATLRDNCIAGNTLYGVYAKVEVPAGHGDARENWWGNALGPSHPSNPGGKGDIATSQILVDNWLLKDNCFAAVVADVLGAAGGTVSSDKISVTLPAGALGADARVTLKGIDPSSMADKPKPPADLVAVRVFEIEAEGVGDGTPVTRLDKSATLRVEYSEQECARVDETSLGIYHLNPGSLSARGAAAPLDGEAWILLPGSLDTEHDVLMAEVGQLGTFALMGEARAQRAYLPLILR